MPKIFRSKNGGRSRALQDEFSLPSDFSAAVTAMEEEDDVDDPPPRADVAGMQSELVWLDSKSSKSSKSTKYCLDSQLEVCARLTTLFDNPLDSCYTLPALTELLLDQIPKCARLLLYGILGECVCGGDGNML